MRLGHLQREIIQHLRTKGLLTMWQLAKFTGRWGGRFRRGRYCKYPSSTLRNSVGLLVRRGVVTMLQQERFGPAFYELADRGPS